MARRTRRTTPSRTCAASCEAGINAFDCADHYVGVEETIGAFRRRYPELGRQLRVSTKYTPDCDAAAGPEAQRCRGDHRHVAEAARRRAAGPGAVPLVGLRDPRLRAGHAVAAGAAEGRQDRACRHDQLQRAAFARDARRRRHDPEQPAAVQPPGPAAGERDGGAVPAARHPPALLRHAGRRLPVGSLARPAAPDAAVREPLADQVPADHRGVRRLGRLPGAAAGGFARSRSGTTARIAAVAARFVLDKPQVAAALVGAKDARHLDETMAIFSLQLDAAGPGAPGCDRRARRRGRRATATTSSATRTASTRRSCT